MSPAKVTIDQLQEIETFEELSELYSVEEVVGILVRYEKGRAKMRESNAKSRAILRYAKDHPDEFKEVL